jgi:hypothetical protein
MFGRKNRGIDSFDSETAGRKRGRWLNLGSAAVLVTVFYYLIGMVTPGGIQMTSPGFISRFSPFHC